MGKQSDPEGTLAHWSLYAGKDRGVIDGCASSGEYLPAATQNSNNGHVVVRSRVYRYRLLEYQWTIVSVKFNWII